jgi:hypothetical protein
MASAVHYVIQPGMHHKNPAICNCHYALSLNRGPVKLTRACFSILLEYFLRDSIYVISNSQTSRATYVRLQTEGKVTTYDDVG